MIAFTRSLQPFHHISINTHRSLGFQWPIKLTAFCVRPLLIAGRRDNNLDKGNIQFDRLVIECTGMADPGPIIRTFFSHEILCQRYLLDGVIALVDAVHADEQMNQFTIAQSQVGYADRILLTKTDVAGEAEKTA